MFLDGCYEGEFRCGEYSGQGKMFFADGGYIEGLWNDGAMNGQGKRVFSNGVVHVGVFKDQRLLEGHAYDANGKLIETFMNGYTFVE